MSGPGGCEHLADIGERFWADAVVREWEESGEPADDLWDGLGV